MKRFQVYSHGHMALIHDVQNWQDVFSQISHESGLNAPGPELCWAEDLTSSPTVWTKLAAPISHENNKGVQKCHWWARNWSSQVLWADMSCMDPNYIRPDHMIFGLIVLRVLSNSVLQWCPSFPSHFGCPPPSFFVIHLEGNAPRTSECGNMVIWMSTASISFNFPNQTNMVHGVCQPMCWRVQTYGIHIYI